MARNRMIKPEFWEDEKVGEMSFGARLLFIGSLNYADDEGYIRWNPEYINSSIFIYDKLSKNKIKSFMKELENLKIVEVFETKAHFFVAKIKNFKKHQKISHPQATKFDIDFETKNESEVLKNQQEIKNKSVNGSVNDSVNGSVNDSALKEVKEKLKEVKGKEDKEKGKESVKGKPNGENPEPPFFNSSKLETANDKQQTATAEKSKIPKGYQQLVDYLVDKYGYDLDKAKLVANRVQSDKFELSPIHCESFVEMEEADIVKCFDVMKNIYSKKSKSVFKKV